MKKLITILTLLIAFTGCVKNIDHTIYVDSFTGTASEKIKAAFDSAKTGDVIQFRNFTYVLDRSIRGIKSVTLRGDDSTIITRPNQSIRFLTIAADSTSTSLTLNDASGIQEGDYIVVYNGDSLKNGVDQIVVRGVSGNTLKVSPFRLKNGSGLFPVGMKVQKSIGFIEVFDPKNVNSTANKSIRIENITFDGNRANNSDFLAYNFNMAIISETNKRVTITGCTFINAPTETIVGHNLDILYNRFKNNNGSIYHGSINKEWIAEDMFMTNIIGNISDSSNQVSTLVSGHSEGLLTTSNSGGFVNVTGNRFLHIGSDAGVIGALYPSSTFQDWGTSNYNFSGNIVNGASRLIYLINTTTKGYLGNVYINNNSLWNVGTYDYSEALRVHPEMVINQTNK